MAARRLLLIRDYGYVTAAKRGKEFQSVVFDAARLDEISITYFPKLFYELPVKEYL